MENRFIDMEFATYNGKQKKAGTPSSIVAARLARSFEAVAYTVPGLVNPLKQPSGMVCWATVTTMMVSWKQQQSLSIEKAIGDIGAAYLGSFKKNQGLTAKEKIPFLQAAGLAFEYPESLSVTGWERLMRNYGPVWVTTAEGSDQRFGIHARIITAINGDGTADGTTLTIVDPGTGTTYPEKFADFLVKFEREVRVSSDWDGRIQIVHWPASATRAQSFSADITQAAGISDQGIQFIKQFEGYIDHLYNDPAGHCTVGYGTLLHKGNCNGAASEQPYTGGVSEEKATALLKDEVKKHEQTIKGAVTVGLNQNQLDSLLSFTYNVGDGNFRQSTLLKLLNEGNYTAVPAELKKWTKARVDGKLVDLPGLVKRRNAEAALFAAPVTVSAQSIIDNLSQPFYDTGEHALFGEFINAAVSGPLASVVPLQPTTTFTINNVAFTYGQIITMGDFYDNYDELKAAKTDELTRVKNLVIKSENHYKNTILGIGPAVADVTNAQWGDPATGIGERYIGLALKNNSHFAPPSAGTTSSLANNKQSWEMYHSRAIQTARSAGKPPFDAAYTINAFGDHFLTDAFSAGHLINKEMVMNKFLANCFSGGSLNSAADKMLEKVANGALAIPAVKRKLGRFEVAETHWYLLEKHFNLDTTTPNVFYRVLKGVMEDTAHGGRQQIANLAAKAIHDYLNNYKNNGVKGVPVKNNKGMAWNLTGDGTLSWDKNTHTNNLEIIQLAVKQSVENIDDAVKNPTTPVATLQQKVWDYVPNLTDPNTRTVVDWAVNTFTNPSSQQLIDVAVKLVEGELDILLDRLKQAGKIRSVNTSWWG